MNVANRIRERCKGTTKCGSMESLIEMYHNLTEYIIGVCRRIGVRKKEAKGIFICTKHVKEQLAPALERNLLLWDTML